MNKSTFSHRPIKTNAGQANLTLYEVADMLNLTRERVRKIEAKALTKLRKHLQERGIKPSDLLGN
jgi:DNA-directed RNA polymerase sigma subunit (sigma70/sigma32)